MQCVQSALCRTKLERRILVVDDDEGLIRLVVRILRTAGYVTWGTKSPEDALRRARTARPDLVISDVIMSRMDGFDLCSMIKNHPESRDVRVLFLSAARDPGSHQKARTCGADAYLDKPFRVNELLETVQTILGGTKTEPSLS